MRPALGQLNPFDPISWFTGGLETAIEWFADRLAGAAATVVRWLLDFATAATTPDLSAGWYLDVVSRAWGVGFVIALVLWLAAMASGVPRGLYATVRPTLLLAGMQLAVLGTVTVLPLAIAATDHLAEWLVGGLSEQIGQAAAAATGGTLTPGPDMPAVLAILFLAVVLGAALLAFLVLLLREAVLFLMPPIVAMAFAGMVWPRTAHIARRTLRLLVAAVVGKLPLVLVFAIVGGLLGSAAAASSSGAEQAKEFLLLAALLAAAPLVAYAVVAWLDAGATSIVSTATGRSLDRARRAARPRGRAGPTVASRLERNARGRPRFGGDPAPGGGPGQADGHGGRSGGGGPARSNGRPSERAARDVVSREVGSARGPRPSGGPGGHGGPPSGGLRRWVPSPQEKPSGRIRPYVPDQQGGPAEASEGGAGVGARLSGSRQDLEVRQAESAQGLRRLARRLQSRPSTSGREQGGRDG